MKHAHTHKTLNAPAGGTAEGRRLQPVLAGVHAAAAAAATDHARKGGEAKAVATKGEDGVRRS